MYHSRGVASHFRSPHEEEDDEDDDIKEITKTLREDPNLDIKPIADQLRKLREELKIINNKEYNNMSLYEIMNEQQETKNT